MDLTLYKFESMADAFEGVLDVFAQFFICKWNGGEAGREERGTTTLLLVKEPTNHSNYSLPSLPPSLPPQPRSSLSRPLRESSRQLIPRTARI